MQQKIPLYIIPVILALIQAVPASCQQEMYLQEETESETDRKGMFYLVPEAGLWFGNYTHIEVAPQLGYHLTDRISLGAGTHYMFYRNRDYFSTVVHSTHIWGIRGFSRISVIRDAARFLPFYLFDELFLHGEYERMNLDNSYFNNPAAPLDDRYWMDYLYLGFGISQRIGPRSSYTVMLLWNLNDSYFSLYNNPTFRIGMNIYF